MKTFMNKASDTIITMLIIFLSFVAFKCAMYTTNGIQAIVVICLVIVIASLINNQARVEKKEKDNNERP